MYLDLKFQFLKNFGIHSSLVFLPEKSVVKHESKMVKLILYLTLKLCISDTFDQN